MADNFFERQLNNENHFIANGSINSIVGGADRLSSALNDTMRNFSDQLHFQLQSLNLTLSTLNSGVYNLNSKISTLSPNVAGQYIPAGQNPGTFLGNLSREYVNAQGRYLGSDALLFGDAAFINKPYNVSGLEYYTGAAMQRQLYRPKIAANILNGIVDAITPGSTLSTLFGDAMFTGTHAYLDNADMIRRMSGRFGAPMGMAGSYHVARNMQNLAFREMMTTSGMNSRLGLQGYTDITALGLQSNLFQGNNPNQLIDQVKEAGKVVKVLTGILGSKDVKEAMESIVQLKNMGLNLAQKGGADFMRALNSNSYGYGFMNSMTSGQMLNAGVQIAQSAFGTNGIPAALGVQQGMQNLAYVNELRKRGILSAADIARGGGEESIAARSLSSTAKFLNSGMGQTWFAAGFNGGKFDPNRANLAFSGQMGGFVGTGIGNMLGGKGFISNWADASLNMDNYLVDSLKDNPNALVQADRYKLKMIARYIAPILNQKGNTLEDKRNILAMTLVNYGYDKATAKQMATRYYDRTIDKDIEAQNKNSVAQSEVNRLRVRNSAGGSWQRLVTDPLARLTSKIQQPFVEFGENMMEFFTPKDAYRNIGASLQAGKEMFYSDVLDANGNKTGESRLDYEKIGKNLEELYGAENLIDQKNLFNTVGGQLGDWYDRGEEDFANLFLDNGLLFLMGEGKNYSKAKGLRAYQRRQRYNKQYRYLQKGENLTSNYGLNKGLKKLYASLGLKGNYTGLNTSDIEELAEGAKGGDLERFGIDLLARSADKNTQLSGYLGNILKNSNISLTNDITKKIDTNYTQGMQGELNSLLESGRGQVDKISSDRLIKLASSLATAAGISQADALKFLIERGSSNSGYGTRDALINKLDNKNLVGAMLASGTDAGKSFIDTAMKSKTLSTQLNYEDLILNGDVSGDIQGILSSPSKYNIEFLKKEGLFDTRLAKFFKEANTKFNSSKGINMDTKGSIAGFWGSKAPKYAAGDMTNEIGSFVKEFIKANPDKYSSADEELLINSLETAIKNGYDMNDLFKSIISGKYEAVNDSMSNIFSSEGKEYFMDLSRQNIGTGKNAKFNFGQAAGLTVFEKGAGSIKGLKEDNVEAYNNLEEQRKELKKDLEKDSAAYTAFKAGDYGAIQNEQLREKTQKYIENVNKSIQDQNARITVKDQNEAAQDKVTSKVDTAVEMIDGRGVVRVSDVNSRFTDINRVRENITKLSNNASHKSTAAETSKSGSLNKTVPMGE